MKEHYKDDNSKPNKVLTKKMYLKKHSCSSLGGFTEDCQIFHAAV